MYLVGLFFIVVPNLVLCPNEQLIDKYVQQIDDFIESTTQWVRPNNSYAYAEGAELKLYDGGTFDFIIVGGGSAGSVIANRLSEIINWKVLLLEAGSLETDITDIPAMFPYLPQSDKNWGYQTIPQKYSCQGSPERRCDYPRGRVLGGTSVINGMAYSRGSKSDYDMWEAQGNPGWSYKDVFPFFLKSEDADLPDAEPGYHSKGGYLHVESVRYKPLIGHIFLNGSEELGRNIVDYNGRSTFGSSWAQVNTLKGTRFSAARAFINPVSARRNLVIRLNALALKMATDEQQKRVYGVYYIHNKKHYLARALKEVIVSAGAINSPQLLLLSGIGPKDQLNSLNIKVMKDLPVGQNLRDHVVVFGPAYTTSIPAELSNVKKQVQNYLRGYGNLTVAVGGVALSYIKTKSWKENRPNIEIYMLAEGNTMSFMILLLHPKSRGSVTLKTSNPLDFPNIDLNLYSAKEDMLYMIEGIRSVLELNNTETFRRYNSTLIFSPGNCTQELLSQEFFECILPSLSEAGCHAVGSCKMGPKNDPEAVVDNELRVHGIQGLRVADCSVIPVTISGHTNVPAYTVGEKASNIIKENYGIYYGQTHFYPAFRRY